MGGKGKDGKEGRFGKGGEEQEGSGRGGIASTTLERWTPLALWFLPIFLFFLA